MPIRNMGTLLENIVLLEAFRLTLRIAPPGTIEFANSFAMPPLSAWQDNARDACFSAHQLADLQADPEPAADTYAGILWRCLQAPVGQPPPSGPNGALLCAMLAAQNGRALRMWLNDIPEGRYGNALPALATIGNTVMQLLNLQMSPRIDVITCAAAYPESLMPPALNNLQSTFNQWPGDAQARLGYLDPMRYRTAQPRDGETSTTDHQEWLHILSDGFNGPALSVHFTGHRYWEQLTAEVAQICQDGIAQGYPHSLTARHAEYHVVTVFRDPRGVGAAYTHAENLRVAVLEQWAAWCNIIQHVPPCALTVEIN